MTLDAFNAVQWFTFLNERFGVLPHPDDPGETVVQASGLPVFPPDWVAPYDEWRTAMHTVARADERDMYMAIQIAELDALRKRQEAIAFELMRTPPCFDTEAKPGYQTCFERETQAAAKLTGRVDFLAALARGWNRYQQDKMCASCAAYWAASTTVNHIINTRNRLFAQLVDMMREAQAQNSAVENRYRSADNPGVRHK